jgi:hypothetical protein
MLPFPIYLPQCFVHPKRHVNINNRGKYEWKAIPFLLLMAFILAARFRLIFSYSVDMDGAEYTYIHLIQRLILGHDLYNNSVGFPFIQLVYTPLYFYIYYSLCKLFHLHSLNDIHAIYIVGRTLSFVVFLCQAWFIYKVLQRYALSLFYRLVTLTLYMLLITGGVFVAKMDGMKIIFFTTFLIFLIDNFFYKASFRSVFLSIATGLVAISIKQDALIYIAASLAVLTLIKPDRKTIQFCLWFALSVVSLFIIYYLLFGPYFFGNIIYYNFQVLTNFSTGSTILFILLFSIARTGPMLAICLLNIYLLHRKKCWSSPEMYVSLLAMLFFLMAHFAMLKPGGYLNYSYEAIVLLTFSFAAFIKTNKDAFRIRLPIKMGLLGTYILFLLGCNHLLHCYYNRESESSYEKVFFSYSAEREKINAVIGNSLVFFPNPKYITLFADRNILYGYEYHADRYINLLEGLKIKSRLLLLDSTDYDNYFLTGKVKYLIVENKAVNKKHIREYYQRFVPFYETDNFAIYSFM